MILNVFMYILALWSAFGFVLLTSLVCEGMFLPRFYLFANRHPVIGLFLCGFFGWVFLLLYILGETRWHKRLTQ